MNQFIANELRRQQRLGEMVDTRRALNVPSGASTNTPLNNASFGQRVGDFVGSVDDATQTFIRRNVFGESIDGNYTNAIRPALADIFALPREQYMQYPNGAYGLIGSRALQTGAVTAAGYGLAQLTNQIASQFGGEKDEPEVGALYM